VVGSRANRVVLGVFAPLQQCEKLRPAADALWKAREEGTGRVPVRAGAAWPL
jgi:hypothetical protein